jgi:hypothetical protein
MKIGSEPRGFTIVETLIVLAVTGFLFVIVAVLIGGKQNKTQFSTGTRDVESRLQTIINEVANGYYPNTGNFKCDNVAGVPKVVSVIGLPKEQGTNKDCIFLGKVVQFSPDDISVEAFHVYSVVGLRLNSSGDPVKNLTEANPRLIKLTGSFEEQTMPFGMKAVDSVADSNTGSVAFISSLGNLDTSGPSQQMNVYPIPGTTYTQDTAGAIGIIQSPAGLKSAPANPANGVKICLSSGSTEQSALYTIGGSGRQLSVSFVIKDGTSC